MALQIRAFQLSDLPEVERIESDSFQSDAYPRELFVSFFEYQSEGFSVAELNGSLAGYVMVARQRREASIVSLAVASAVRSRGVGRALCRHALRSLRLRGVQRCCLQVRTGNTAAIALYQSLGFRQIAQLRRYYSDGGDAYVMCRAV